MSIIMEVTLPRDERGNDPNDFRDEPDYLNGLESGYSVVKPQEEVANAPVLRFRATENNNHPV